MKYEGVHHLRNATITTHNTFFYNFVLVLSFFIQSGFMIRCHAHWASHAISPSDSATGLLLAAGPGWGTTSHCRWPDLWPPAAGQAAAASRAAGGKAYSRQVGCRPVGSVALLT